MTYHFNIFSNAERLDIGHRAADQIRHYLDENEVLRHSQKSALEAIAEHFDNGGQSGLIKRPTGTGKTVIFGSYIKALQALYGSHTLPKVKVKEEGTRAFEPNFLILVPTTHLAEQTRKELTKEDGLVGMAEDEVAVFKPTDLNTPAHYDEAVEALKAPVTIMTYAAYRTMMHTALEKQQAADDWRDAPEDKYEGLRRYLDSNYRPFTIMDEVDEAVGPVQTPIFKDLARRTHTLGFSATDKCLDEHGELVDVSNVLFRTEQQERDDVDVPPIAALRFKDASRDKDNPELAPTKNVVFELSSRSGVKSSEAEFTQAEQEQITGQKGRDEAAVKKIAEFSDPETGRRFADMQQIWYCSGITHAKRVTDLLNKVHGAGYAVQIDGKTDKDELEKILEGHRERGQPPVLVNADLLIRGFDSPATELCVMLRPSKSPSLVEQAGGRVARLDPNNPHKIGYVVNFVDEDTKDVALFGKVVGGMFITPDGYKIPSDAEYRQGKKHAPVVRNAEPDYSGLPDIDVVSVPETHFELKHIEKFAPSDQPVQILHFNSPFISSSAMENKLHIRSGSLESVYAALESAMLAEAAKSQYAGSAVPPETPITINRDGRALTIPYGDMGEYRFSNQTHPSFYVHNKHMMDIADYLELAELMPNKSWVGGSAILSAVQKRFGEDYGWNRYNKIYSAAERAFARVSALDKPPTQVTLEVGQQKATIPYEDLAFYRIPKGGGKTRLCVKQSSLSNLLSLFNPGKVAEAGFHAIQDSTLNLPENRRKYVYGRIAQVLRNSSPDEHTLQIAGPYKSDTLVIDKADLGYFYNPTYPNVPEQLHIHERCNAAIEAFFAQRSYEPRTEEWAVKSEAAASIGTSATAAPLLPLWRTMEQQFDASGTVTIDGRTVRAERRQSANATPLCLHRDELAWLKERLGKNVEDKTEVWKTRQEAARLIHINRDQPDIVSLWADMERQFDATGKVVIGDRAIKAERRKSGSSAALFLHADELAWLKERLGKNVEAKTEGWMNRVEAAQSVNIGPDTKAFADLWADMQQQYAKTGKVMVAGREVKIENRMVANGPTLCLHKDEIDWLRKAVGKDLPAKTAEWLIKGDAFLAIGYSASNAASTALWEEMERQFDKTGAVVVDGRTIKAARRQAGPTRPLCLHEDETEWLRQRFKVAPKKTPEWKARYEIAQMLKIANDDSSLSLLWQDMEQQFETTGKVVVDGREIKAEKRKSASVTVLYVHEDELEWLRKKLGKDLGEKTDDWKGKTEWAKLIGVSTSSDRLVSLWDEMERQFDDTGRIVIDGREIKAARKQSANSTPLCLHTDELKWLKEKIGKTLGVATEEWMNRTSVAEALNVGNASDDFVAMWKEMERQFDATGEVKLGGVAIRGERRESVSTRAFYVHQDDLPKLKQHFGVVESKTEDWLTRSESQVLLRTSHDNPALIALWEDMEAQLKRSGAVKVGSVPIRAEMRKASRYTILCVHKDDLPKIRAHLGLDFDERTDDWLPKNDAAKSVGITSTSDTFLALWDDMERQYDNAGAVVIDGQTIRAERKRSGSHTPLCLHSDDLQWLSNRFGKNLGEKTDDWLHKSEAGAAANTQGNPQFNALWADMERQFDETGKVVVGGRNIKAERKQSGSAQPLCLHADDVAWLRTYMGKDLQPKTDDWKHKGEAAKLAGTTVGKAPFLPLWEEIERQFDESGSVTIKDRKIRVERKLSNHRSVLCIHVDDIAWLKSYLGRDLRQKETGWMNRLETAQSIGVTVTNERFNEIWGEMQRQLADGSEVVIDGKTIQVENMRVATTSTLCLHENEVEWLKWKMGKESSYDPAQDKSDANEGVAPPSEHVGHNSAAEVEDKEAAAPDDARASLKKPRPSQPRRSEADMTADERAAAKRGGNKRG